ncbi:NUDIX hydrolase [Actinomycetaceae bacterium TAE3-ERU4]|nr:NUDIX hydrolase [Actinomycetaceae bacterium TAE3-ERU4]
MPYPTISADSLADEEASFPVLESSNLWNGHIISVKSDSVALSETNSVLREYVVHPGAVAVVPMREVDGREQVLMIRQYRHPVRKFLWEFPAGLLDVEGEDYLSAAQRELAEETDLRAATWDVLIDFFASPGGHTESLRIFLARDLEFLDTNDFQREDEEALFEWAWIDLDEAVKAVHAGKIHNPNAVMGTLALATARESNWSLLRPVDSPWQR